MRDWKHDIQTDQHTNQWTDTPSYRDARTHLKSREMKPFWKWILTRHIRDISEASSYLYKSACLSVGASVGRSVHRGCGSQENKFGKLIDASLWPVFQLDSRTDQQTYLPIEMQFYISVMFLGLPYVIHDPTFLQFKKNAWRTDQPTDGRTDGRTDGQTLL